MRVAAAQIGPWTPTAWALYLAAIGPAVLSTVWLVRTVYPNAAELATLEPPRAHRHNPHHPEMITSPDLRA